MADMKNQIQLIGNLGRDPETFETADGKKVSRVSLATNESYKNKEGERVTRTEWHNLVAWGPQATYFEKYCQKGSKIGVRGKIQHREYEGKDGEKKKYTEVIVREILSLDGKKHLTSEQA